MTLLTIIQTAADRLSLRRPSVVVTSTDQQVRQLLALANEEGEALSKRTEWEALTAEHLFVTVAAEVQTNTPVPPDLRKFVANSFFNRSQNRRLIGPITSKQYQAMKSGPVTSGIFPTFRQRRGDYLITPAPSAGETVAYEYVSSYWARSDAGQPKAAFTADSDTTYLSEELLIQGVRWRFKQANGLDYGEDMESYERAVEFAAAEDGGSSALTMGAIERDPVFEERPNIPEGGFGL